MRGIFTLQDATRGLKGDGDLVADITTALGTLRCNLFDDRAPVTVANFVGLARGTRPWRNPGGQWVRKPAYDGTSFHRVIKGFMIQGGDPLGTGEGEPGYVIPDEIWPGAVHDRRGQLAMANRGPHTNGMQFFITDGPARHLDGGFTVFGHCAPDEIIDKLASVQTSSGEPARRIERISIRRVTAERAK
jgi:peptidyl-prolyl cis-trans isomerase A (cyclophilin A)